MTVEFRNTVVQISWNGRELQQAVDTEKATALYEGAKVIVSAARPLTPRRSGRLRKSGYAKAAGGQVELPRGQGPAPTAEAEAGHGRCRLLAVLRRLPGTRHAAPSRAAVSRSGA